MKRKRFHRRRGLKFNRHPGLINSQETIKLIPYLKIQTKLNIKPEPIVQYQYVEPNPIFVLIIEFGFLIWEYSLIYEYIQPKIQH